MRARPVAFLFLCSVLIPRCPAGSLTFKNGFAENFLKWVKTRHYYLTVNRSQYFAVEVSAAKPALGQSGAEDPTCATTVLPFAGGDAPAKGLPLKPRSP